MKLLFTPNPDYIHKVLVVAYEAGILDQLEFETTRPFDENSTIWRCNPFGKVPCLIMDDGEPLFGGLLICEYLDSLSVTGRSLYPRGTARWAALRQATLGDGMFDATTLLRVEGWRDPGQWNRAYMLRERKKILSALDRMEREAGDFGTLPLDIGQICMAGGISYLELRNPIREHALEPGDADFRWRQDRPRLAAWYDRIIEIPAMRYKVAIATG
jgi:glutathione S-transferase